MDYGKVIHAARIAIQIEVAFNKSFGDQRNDWYNYVTYNRTEKQMQHINLQNRRLQDETAGMGQDVGRHPIHPVIFACRS